MAGCLAGHSAKRLDPSGGVPLPLKSRLRKDLNRLAPLRRHFAGHGAIWRRVPTPVPTRSRLPAKAASKTGPWIRHQVVGKHFPPLSKPLAACLALWSLGMILAPVLVDRRGLDL